MSTDAAVAASSLDSAQRKRMRKGTRSCLECRKRKIRCIVPTGSQICNSCKANGKTCVEQTYSHVREAGLDKRIGLKQRVKELEALVNQLIERGSGTEERVEIPERYRKKLEERIDSYGRGNEMPSPSDSNASSRSITSSASAAQLARNAHKTISELYDAVEDDIEDEDNTFESPFVGSSTVQNLFDNSIISHERSEGTPRCSAKHHARYERAVQRIRSLVPRVEDLKVLEGKGTIFEPIWRQSLTPEIKDRNAPVESVLREHFQSENLTVVAKGLMYLALILQQLPDDNVGQQLGFPEGLSGKALVQMITEIVDQYLLSHERITGSLEAMECTMLIGQLLTNDGRPRKAWVVFQRTVAYAKLLGYHHPASWRSPVGSNDTNSLAKRRERLWWTLYQGDRYGSLVLDMPYAISDKHVDTSSIAEPRPGGFLDISAFNLKLARITGKIIDRNHSPDRNGPNALASAMSLDGELHALSCQVPETFWDIKNFAVKSQDDIYQLYFRTKAIFWFCECRIMLHLPFIIKALRNSEDAAMYSHSRVVGLSSSRTMMRTHTQLRARPELNGLVCQLLDFQAFTATMLLLLDLIERPDHATEHQDPFTVEDTELIIAVIGTLRQVSRESSGRCDIAGQAVNVLDGVAHVLYGCPSPNKTHPSRVVVPYFGAVTIKPVGRRRCTCCAPSEPVQTATPDQSSSGDSISASGMSTVFTDSSASASVIQGPDTNTQQSRGYPSNDFLTFDSFMGTSTAPSGGYNERDAWASPPDQFGQQGQQDSDSSVVDITMWDDTLWQNMLERDPSLELDGDWSWLTTVYS